MWTSKSRWLCQQHPTAAEYTVHTWTGVTWWPFKIWQRVCVCDRSSIAKVEIDMQNCLQSQMYHHYNGTQNEGIVKTKMACKWFSFFLIYRDVFRLHASFPGYPKRAWSASLDKEFVKPQEVTVKHHSAHALPVWTFFNWKLPYFSTNTRTEVPHPRSRWRKPGEGGDLCQLKTNKSLFRLWQLDIII